MSAPNDPVWYISRDGKRAGPFTAEEFAEFEEAGHLRPTDQIWHTGMQAWIAYGDHHARKTAVRFVDPRAPSSSATTDSEKCTICLLARKVVRALGNAFKTAFRNISTQLAKMRPISSAPPAADTSPATLAERTPNGFVRPSADPGPAPVRPSLFRPRDSNLRQFDSGPVLEQAASSAEGPVKRQDGGTPNAVIEHVDQPIRPSPSAPRLATEGQAAADIGLDLGTFRAWVADGRLPRALPDCGRHDMKAIHLALDRMSGIASRDNGSNDLFRRLARDKS